MRSARDEIAPEEVRARVAAVLGVAAATTAGAGVATSGGWFGAAAKTTGVAKGVGATMAVASSGKLAAIVLASTVAALGAAHQVHNFRQTPTTRVAAAASPAVSVPELPAANIDQNAKAELITPPENAPLPAPHAAPGVRQAPAQQMPSQPASSAESEFALVERAQSSLRKHQPAEALRELQKYFSGFPTGELAPEARLLEIDALRALGQDAAASEKQRGYLQIYPDSPGALRLEREAAARD